MTLVPNPPLRGAERGNLPLLFKPSEYKDSLSKTSHIEDNIVPSCAESIVACKRGCCGPMQKRKPRGSNPSALAVQRNWLRRPRTLLQSYAIQSSGASGGAGGGIRTRKDFRPETCEVSAFASFATPAPRRLQTLASPKAETPNLARAAVPWRPICRCGYGVTPSNERTLVRESAVEMQSSWPGSSARCRSERAEDEMLSRKVARLSRS